MPDTNEKNVILQNLNYIGLDLNDIPEFLSKYEDVDLKPTQCYNQTDFKVYKTIPLTKIQILLAPKNRMDSIIDKYEKALPICEYLKDQDEKNIAHYAKFLNMVEHLNRKEIDLIEKEQQLAKEEIPFKVKFDTNYLWEVFYSEYTGKYFMMLTTEDQNYSAFFYLLKKQIECWKEKKKKLFLFLLVI